MDTSLTIGTVCFIQDVAKKRVLVLERSREPMMGKCTGVGGKTEIFEDIRTSCFREVLEETGLAVHNLELKGIVKTVLQGTLSSWILFVYCADASDDHFASCDEGRLQWVKKEEIGSTNLIGFIRTLMPHIFSDGTTFEGTITHDMEGRVICEEIFFRTA